MTYIPQCDCCHKKNISLAPMFKDATWQRLAEEREFLCDNCAFNRATERQVDLTFHDLLPCAFNLRGWPFSWFNLFLCNANVPLVTKNISNEWRDAMIAGTALAEAMEREQHPETEDTP